MNLTETQAAVKKGLLTLAVVISLYYTGKFILIKGVEAYRNLFPPELPMPESKFGKLPALKMTSFQTTGTPVYILDTETGTLPKFPDRINVYPINQPQATLLSESKMKQIATDLGFTSNFIKESASQFKWVDGFNDRTFKANVVTKNFNLSTSLSKLGAVLTKTQTITKNDAIEAAKNFIKSKSLLTSKDLANIHTTTIPTIINIGRLKDTRLFPRQAKLIKVDFFRDLVITKQDPETDAVKKIAQYEILGPNPKNSLISIFVSNDKKTFKLPIIDFKYWEVDFNNASNYFLSDIAQVWEAVQQGKGITSYIKLDTSGYYDSYETLDISKVEIRDIKIAYFEPKELSKYLQPIYVFEGVFETSPKPGKLPAEGEIVVYYPAIRGDWVE